MSKRTLLFGGLRTRHLLAGGLGPGLSPGPGGGQTFREALVAKLRSISGLTGLVGTAIYAGSVPQSHDLGRDGPVLTYAVISNPRGHVLTGADGRATARVQLSAWAYKQSSSDRITLALWQALDGIPVNPWGDGTVEIMAVVHQDEHDLPHPPKAGTDQWSYEIATDWLIMHKTGYPSLV